MPWQEINKYNIIFDPEVQTYCVSGKFKCPNYDKMWACPPAAPYLEEEIMSYDKFYIVYLKEFLPKDKGNIRHKLSTFKLKDWEKMRDSLQRELMKLAEKLRINNDNIRILWEGHCQICEKEGKKCTYIENTPCRYPDKLRYSMESVGIDVTATTKNLGLDLEWPPKYYILRCGLICVKNSSN